MQAGGGRRYAGTGPLPVGYASAPELFPAGPALRLRGSTARFVSGAGAGRGAGLPRRRLCLGCGFRKQARSGPIQSGGNPSRASPDAESSALPELGRRSPGAQVQSPSRPGVPAPGERPDTDESFHSEAIGPGPSSDIVSNIFRHGNLALEVARCPCPWVGGTASPSRRIGNAPSRPRAVTGHARVSHSGPWRSASRWPTARVVSGIGLVRRSGAAPPAGHMRCSTCYAVGCYMPKKPRKCWGSAVPAHRSNHGATTGRDFRIPTIRR
jgi:hypothetical protein